MEEPFGLQPLMKGGSTPTLPTTKPRTSLSHPPKTSPPPEAGWRWRPEAAMCCGPQPTPEVAPASGPVTVANDVVFGGSTSSQGPLYAMHAKTGKILWSHPTGATMYGGVSASEGCVYFGNGYKVFVGFVRNYTSGKSLYAFCV